MSTRHLTLALALVTALVGAACTTTSTPTAPPMAPNPSVIVLSGAHEVPPNGSAGTGTAQVELEGTTLRWTITWSGTSGPVTAGHFHGPAAAGSNAGVVLPFKPPYTSPIRGEAQVKPEQVADIKAGLWYVNLHTAQYPAGELRGQVR